MSTWIGPEEDAHNTYSGAHTGSNRRGRVRFPDGEVRTVTLGVADSFYTIPAHGRVHGRYVSGFVHVASALDAERGSIAGIPFPGMVEGDHVFTPSKRYR